MGTELTINAGIDENTVVAHVDDGNFRDVPTMMMDLFDMEGNVNEHQSSTGILDCETSYPESGNGSCTFDAVTGDNKCPTPNKNCRTTSVEQKKFDAFFEAADNNTDGIITFEELDAVEELYNDETVSPESVDFNHGTQTGNEEHPEVEGTVAGAFRFLIQVFGESCDSISVQSLETVLIDNMYPAHYTFPSSRNCKDVASVPDVSSVICPFLATLIKQGALPVRDVYSQDQLSDVTIMAGLDAESVMGHVND